VAGRTPTRRQQKMGIFEEAKGRLKKALGDIGR
jgi:hypothetical protein